MERDIEPTEWVYAPPGSVGGLLFEKVCKE